MAVLCLWATWISAAAHASGPNLVILVETGTNRDGVPVLKPHPDASAISRLLARGFSGWLLRLYQYEQEYLRRAAGWQTEPAYLLLSGRQGGFPRFGFYLEDQDKRQAGYVDLYKSSSARSRFGGIDQIFPHELLHIIVQQLAGETEGGGSNQVHAIGVRTDPRQAFLEGFAEHCQVMAIDDPDAEAATRALASDAGYRAMAEEQVSRYMSEMLARWAPAGPMRMGFLMWFSGTEQAWRYFKVKENAFAHEIRLPETVLSARDLYPAYLLQNVLPGDLQGPPKPASILLSTEGVVSALFYRWASHNAIRQRYRDDEFYARFGVRRSDVSPLENVYLKLFHVLFEKKPTDTAAMVQGYKSIFPDEAPWIDSLVREALLGQALPVAPAIWLANRNFQTGTSLFDQFRSLPRTHTFDLNAATLVDLLGVPGMTRSLADRILKGAPYDALSELQRVPELPPGLLAQFHRMSREMEILHSGGGESETMLNLGTILWSYAWRALVILALASAAGAFLYRRVAAAGWFCAAVDGFAASLLVLGLAWLTTGTKAHIAFLGPVFLLGVPAALWQWARHHRSGHPIRVLLAWMAAELPAILLAYPWL
jgi:hypothetical protein